MENIILKYVVLTACKLRLTQERYHTHETQATGKKIITSGNTVSCEYKAAWTWQLANPNIF